MKCWNCKCYLTEKQSNNEDYSIISCDRYGCCRLYTKKELVVSYSISTNFWSFYLDNLSEINIFEIVDRTMKRTGYWTKVAVRSNTFNNLTVEEFFAELPKLIQKIENIFLLK